MTELTEEEILENFILNNPELDQLENMLSQFNALETLNIVNAELRHSNILAWLFNPNSNHGIGEYFLKQFLKYFVRLLQSRRWDHKRWFRQCNPRGSGLDS